MMAVSLPQCLMLLVLMLPAVQPAKLLLMTASVNSHVNYIARLGLALAQGGHDVTTLVPSVSRVPGWYQHERVEVIKYFVPGDEPYTNSPRASEMLVKQAFAESMRERIGVMSMFGKEVFEAWRSECESLMTNEELKEKLRARKFDHSIVDGALFDCQMALPYALDVPISVFSLFSAPWGFRVPALPSFYPSLFAEFGDVMTFWERVQNVFAEVSMYALHDFNVLRENTRRYVPERPEIDRSQMMGQVKLWFLIHDIATGYPLPTMPNVIPVGDVLAVPAEPLQDEFTQFLSTANHGAILVSFGSAVEYLPKSCIKKLCEAFKQIPQKVLWKLKESELCPNDGRIMMKNWLPQNDLLGHPKVKLFISHVGVSSVVETIYHGVPVISVPVGIDQPFQATFMTSRKFGTRLSLKDFTIEQLVENIDLVINSKEIRGNIERASAILKDKADNASTRASYWVDHVIKYDDKHLRSGAFKLSILEFYMVDVFLFLTCTIVSILIGIVLILYCTCRLFKRMCCKSTEKKKLKVN